MPEGYEKIKQSLKSEHPNWTLKKRKKVAAKIWNKEKAGTGQTVGNGRK